MSNDFTTRPTGLRALLPAALGLGLGLAVGAIWWFAWGCHTCDPNGTPEAKVLFAGLVGTVAGHFFFREP